MSHFLTSLTRKTEIGSNSYFLEIDGLSFLLDCGSHPKIDGWEATPRFELLNEKKLNAILISHAHLDHIGSLPLAWEKHSDVPIYMTHGTHLIADRALHNSASVMVKQRGELDLPEYPLYTHGQVDRLLKEIHPVTYQRPFEVRHSQWTWFEAGHVHGAAGLFLETERHAFFYTGDVNYTDMKVTRAAQFPMRTVDTLMIECTRGATESRPDRCWETETQRLVLEIQKTFDRGGSVLIPCFALGKTQEMLKLLHDQMTTGKLPKRPIYISGLGSSYNEIYDELAKSHPRVCPHFKIQTHIATEVLERKIARTMDIGRGEIFLVSSGMMTPKTMSNFMARRMIEDPRHSIFFVGYVDPDSPAGQLKKARFHDELVLDPEGGAVSIKATVSSFDFTSHCDRNDMLKYIQSVHPKNVILVHGEEASLMWFHQQLSLIMPQTKVIIPSSGIRTEIQ